MVQNYIFPQSFMVLNYFVNQIVISRLQMLFFAVVEDVYIRI